MGKKNRDFLKQAILSCMPRTPFVPDRTAQALQKEADNIAAMAVPHSVSVDGKPFGKVTHIQIGDVPYETIAVDSVTSMQQAEALAKRSLLADLKQSVTVEFFDKDGNPIVRNYDLVVAPISDDSKRQIEADMSLAAESVLTPEELAALKQEREAPGTICPKCHTGYAGGLGWNIGKDRCGACGYQGHRRKASA